MKESWDERQPSDRFSSDPTYQHRSPYKPPAILFRVLTPKRWELIEQLQGLGPCSVRALARTLGRDVKRVHTNVIQLIERGLVERTDDGQVWVPYDVIHADLRAVA